MPSAPRPPLFASKIQHPLGYTDVDKIERRINNNLDGMTNTDIEKMMRMMTE